MARTTRFAGRSELVRGTRTAARENSAAYGFSIMITASYGVVGSLSAKPEAWHTVLFALGGVLGFVLVLLVSTKGFRDESTEAERTHVLLVASLLAVVSVLAGVGAATLVAWLLGGWYSWLLAAIAASSAFLVTNGLEYAVAQHTDEPSDEPSERG